MGLASQIVSLEDEEEFVNLLVYGKSGIGKTVLAGSGGRVLFLAPEDDGTISAKRQGSKAKKWPIKKWSDLAQAVGWISENIDEVQKNFDWIAVDSLTYMQRLMLRSILEVAVDENPARDIDIPAIQDYQKWQNMFTRFVQEINSLPINVIWTALVRNEEDENGDDFLTPDIQGKGYQMSQTISSYMTSYGYMQAEEVRIRRNGEFVKNADGSFKTKIRRVITWQDQGNIQGKDRTDALAPTTVDLNLVQLQQLISGEKTREDLRKKPPVKKAPATDAEAEAPPVTTDDDNDEDKGDN